VEPERDEEGVIGAPAYRSPEQLRGDAIDRRADLFATGAVLWSALTGQPLFADPSYGQTIVNVLRKEIEPPSAYGAPPVLDEICRRALARAPRDRYQSAEEMRVALHDAATREGLIAGSREIGAWVRRVAAPELKERRQLAVEATVALPTEIRIPAGRPRRRPPVPRRRPWLAIVAVALMAAAGALASHRVGLWRAPPHLIR
jgi:hypothetical protein